MINIKKFKIANTYVAAEIISNTFKKYNSKDGSRKAVDWYVDYYNPKKNFEKVKLKFSKTEIFFVAIDGEKIVGVVRGEKHRVVNLFVDSKYHKKGIGRKLMERFEKECIQKGSKRIKLKASIYAIPFYEKMKYKKTTGVRNFMGLKVCPMKKNV